MKWVRENTHSSLFPQKSIHCLEVPKGMEWNGIESNNYKKIKWNGMYLSKRKGWKIMEWNEIK